MANENSDATEIALLAVEVKNAVASIGRVESKVNELLAIDRTMAQMQQDASHQRGEISQIWSRIDGHGSDLNQLATETRAFINRAGGAWIAAAAILTLVQVGIFASVGWVFTSVQSTRELTAVHEHRLKVLEGKETSRGNNER